MTQHRMKAETVTCTKLSYDYVACRLIGTDVDGETGFDVESWGFDIDDFDGHVDVSENGVILIPDDTVDVIFEVEQTLEDGDVIEEYKTGYIVDIE